MDGSTDRNGVTTYRALAAWGVLAGRVVHHRGRRHVDAHSIVSGVVAVGPAAAGGGGSRRPCMRTSSWGQSALAARPCRCGNGGAPRRRRCGSVGVARRHRRGSGAPGDRDIHGDASGRRVGGLLCTVTAYYLESMRGSFPLHTEPSRTEGGGRRFLLQTEIFVIK